jgi:hypothetical protein
MERLGRDLIKPAFEHGVFEVHFTPDSDQRADIPKPSLMADSVEKGGSCDAGVSVIQSL